MLLKLKKNKKKMKIISYLRVSNIYQARKAGKRRASRL